MKKIFIILAIAFTGCKKETIEPEVCNCGLVQSDSAIDYSVIIQNSCSGNNKTFYLQQGDWMNAHVGSTYCITNETSW